VLSCRRHTLGFLLSASEPAMDPMRRALTSERSLRATSFLLLVSCAISVFRNLHGQHAADISQILVPRSFSCRLMELTSILGWLASRAELQELYAGGYNARRRGYLSLAFLLQSLCMILFECSSALYFFLLIGLLICQLGALLFVYHDLDFGPAFLSPWIIRAAAGAGIAWAILALCLQVQKLADHMECGMAPPTFVTAVVTALTSAMGLAVCLRYDWMLAASVAFSLFGMSQNASQRGHEETARLCRRATALSMFGASLALRCAYNRQRKLHRSGPVHAPACTWKRMDSSVEEEFENSKM